MTDEERDSLGEAIVLAEQDQRDVWIGLQAEQESRDRARARLEDRPYRCTAEGCSGDLTEPATCCPNCLYVAFIEAQLAARAPMLSPWHIATGAYFANAADAEAQQRWLLEKRQRFADRVRSVLAQRLVDRVAERVDVDEGTYLEALAMIAGAWALRDFPHLRDTLEYVANVEWPVPENEPEREQAGRRAWQDAGYEITDAGRAALSDAEAAGAAPGQTALATLRLSDVVSEHRLPNLAAWSIA